MPNLLAPRSIATLACSVAIVGLAFAASDTASADPIAPPTTMTDTVSFVVPLDPAHAASPISVIGNFKNPLGAADPSAVTVTTRCNGVSVYTANVMVSDSWSGPKLQHNYFTTTVLPASERGHTCVVSTTAPSGQKLVMSKPYQLSADASIPLSVFVMGEAIARSSTGGL